MATVAPQNDARKQNEKDSPQYELHNTVQIYCSFYSFTIYKPQISGVIVNGPVTEIKEQFDSSLSLASQILFNQQITYHLVGDDSAGSAKVVCHPNRYHTEVFRSGVGGGFGQFSHLSEGLADAIGATEETVIELMDFFNPKIITKYSRRGTRREKWIKMSLGRVPVERYTEEMIEADLRTLAKYDENIRNVIDLPGIFTTADAERDRAMIADGLDSATRRLKAAGRYPVVIE